MKQLLVVVSIVIFQLPLKAQDKTLSKNEIPKQIVSYLNKNFSQAKILKAKEEKGDKSTSYEIQLDNGIELEFNAQKKIKEIDGKKNPIPNALVPNRLLKYATANYPTKNIVAWELNTMDQELKLDDGTELKFTLGGDFIKVDK